MKISNFADKMKETAVKDLLSISENGTCIEKTYKFKAGHATIITIRGGAIEKAAVTHMALKGISINRAPDEDMGVAYSRKEGNADTEVYQMEVFPENPYCPMGHFNTEWSMLKTGFYQYTMNLDLFPAITIAEDLETMRTVMDGVAEKYAKDKHRMREGLDTHYNMEHWPVPLATKVGCKLIALEENEIDLFIEAYHVFFNTYMNIVKKRKDTNFSEKETKLKTERNSKWLAYITLKDKAIQVAHVMGISPEVIIALSYPPSAAF